MTLQLDTFIYGDPKGQPRPRRGKGKSMYTPDDAPIVAWRATVAFALKNYKLNRARGHTGPYVVDLDFYMPRPKSHFRNRKHGPAILTSTAPLDHVQTPDKDNLYKPVADELENAKFLTNDSAVTKGTTTKQWAQFDEKGKPRWNGVAIQIYN